MTRDAALEDQMIADFGQGETVSGRPMFGGYCLMLKGNMLGAARAGRAMFRVGRQAEATALALPGTEPMSQGGRRMPGYVWLSGPPLADDDTRVALARMALDHVSTLPPKES